MEVTKQEKEHLLISMNNIICHLNDEDAIEPWLWAGVPDGADDEYIREMAADDEEFTYCVSLFLDIMRKKSAYDGGICLDTKAINYETRKVALKQGDDHE